MKMVTNQKRCDVFYPARMGPTGVSLMAFSQNSPGNMIQFPVTVIQGINTMMSPREEVNSKDNGDNTSGKSESQME